MKIFGIGLPKTGTNSLCEALKVLGYRAAHQSGRQMQIADKNRPTGRRLFFGMDHEFDAFTDQPCMWDYRRLDRDYPGSKFIWTHRDLVSWLRSMERMMLKYIRTSTGPVPERWMTFEKWLAMYKQHMEEVPAYFAGRSDLLSFPLGTAGWAQLSGFLRLPVPTTTYPWKNEGVASYGNYSKIPRLTYRSEVQCRGEKDSHLSSTKRGC